MSRKWQSFFMRLRNACAYGRWWAYSKLGITRSCYLKWNWSLLCFLDKKQQVFEKLLKTFSLNFTKESDVIGGAKVVAVTSLRHEQGINMKRSSWCCFGHEIFLTPRPHYNVFSNVSVFVIPKTHWSIRVHTTPLAFFWLRQTKLFHQTHLFDQNLLGLQTGFFAAKRSLPKGIPF